jgi:hypothetical protein
MLLPLPRLSDLDRELMGRGVSSFEKDGDLAECKKDRNPNEEEYKQYRTWQIVRSQGTISNDRPRIALSDVHSIASMHFLSRRGDT